MSTRAAVRKPRKTSKAPKTTPAKAKTVRKNTRKAPVKPAVPQPPTANPPAAPAARPVAAVKATGLKVRMYRVGFGDFFLLTIPTAAGPRYILIDCGVFKGTTGKGDLGSIVEAVEDLYQTTGGKLALVIMTHRHADHIAGFSRAPRFKDFTVSMVWMPYWEQFNDAAGSANNLQLEITQLAFRLAMQFRGRDDEAARMALDQLANATGVDFNAAAKGKPSGGNAAALDILKNQFGKNGKNVRYYAAHDTPELPPELAGLTAEILGPPPKDAQAFIAVMDLKKGVGQYLDSTTTSDAGTEAIHPFRSEWVDEQHQEYPDRNRFRFNDPIDYREVQKAVGSAQPDMLAAAAAKIDNFLNNQSLVVLFRFGGKNLLFVGDAQAGNWEDWLYDLKAPVVDPTTAGPLTPESQQILHTIDFYKVGHHGSTNATPIPVVEELRKNTEPNGFVAMCSTQPGVYGTPAKGTEVPRDPLMQAIGAECTLVRSDSFAITPSTGAVAATPGTTLGNPKAGTLTKGKLYVEYAF
jgi:hypothetical protein